MLSVPDQTATDRLILRRHKPEDLDAFAAFLADADATCYMAFSSGTEDACRRRTDARVCDLGIRHGCGGLLAHDRGP